MTEWDILNSQEKREEREATQESRVDKREGFTRAVVQRQVGEREHTDTGEDKRSQRVRRSQNRTGCSS